MTAHRAYNTRLQEFFEDESDLEGFLEVLHHAFFELRDSPLWNEARQILHESSRSAHVRIHQLHAFQGAFYANMVISQQPSRVYIGDISAEYAGIHEERGHETIDFSHQNGCYAHMQDTGI